MADAPVTPSDVRRAAYRLDQCIAHDDEDETAIREAVGMLKDFATLVEAGLRRDKRLKRA